MGKRVVICGVQTLFVRGGAESLVASLERELAARGFSVDVVNLPYKDVPRSEILKGFLLWRWLHLREMHGRPVDLVIGTKFPSYAVRHPHKVVWLVHQHRQAYELYGTPYSDMHARPDGKLFAWLVRRLDRWALGDARQRYAISGNVAARLRRYNGLEATPLYHPPRLWKQLHPGEYGEYVLAVGRFEPIKRFDLIVQAMRLVRSGLRCVLAGDGLARRDLERMVEEAGLRGRVCFAGRVGDRELVDLYAGALGVVYPPFEEDYGYVTLESFLARKPVITTTDAGGVLEFVEDGVTGYAAPPTPEALAECLERLAARPATAKALGEAGYERVQDITWDAVIHHLTAGI
ncbi:MAG: glycosyltransferase family 4 protein [Chloroflexi bacterium]|nr:glycosyltransferase family 4 protein [Chloroflexota bacterium]